VKRQPTTWQQAEAVLQTLSPGERAILLLIARLPFVHTRALARLRGLHGAPISTHRIIVKLTAAGLIAHTAIPASDVASAWLHYVTDLGIAVLALDMDVDAEQFARTFHIDRGALDQLHLRARQVHQVYELLGMVASYGQGRPRLLAWEQPWQRPVPGSNEGIGLPARCVLRWPGAVSGSMLLLPDLATFPVLAYRRTLRRLTRVQASPDGVDEPIVVGTWSERRAAAIQELAAEVASDEGLPPLAMFAAAWPAVPSLVPVVVRHCRQVRNITFERQPVAGRLPATDEELPRAVGNRPPTSQLAALASSDMQLLTVIGRHPFLSLSEVGLVLGWTPAYGRWRCKRLIQRKLVRTLTAAEVGTAATAEPLELTRLGVRLTALWHGLPRRELTRLKLIFGGGGTRTSSTRSDLLRRFEHTQSVNRFFVDLGRLARDSRRLGWNDELVEWQGLPISRQNRPRPDAYGIFRHRGLDYGFFLEYDRGTERARQYERKLAGYYDFAQSGRFERRFDSMPTLLFVTTSRVAERRIDTAACAVVRAKGWRLPTLLTYQALVDSDQKGLLGDVWREPGTRTRREWLTDDVGQALAAGVAASR